jgi:hypothetical protein
MPGPVAHGQTPRRLPAWCAQATVTMASFAPSFIQQCLSTKESQQPALFTVWEIVAFVQALQFCRPFTFVNMPASICHRACSQCAADEGSVLSHSGCPIRRRAATFGPAAEHIWPKLIRVCYLHTLGQISWVGPAHLSPVRSTLDQLD